AVPEERHPHERGRRTDLPRRRLRRRHVEPRGRARGHRAVRAAAPPGAWGAGRRDGAAGGVSQRVSELSWWLAPHPSWEPGEDWDPEVPVVRYETAEEVVLIDPFLPPDGSFDPHGKTVRVLLTQGAHYRGTAD